MKKLMIIMAFAGVLMAGCRTFPPVQNIEHQAVAVHNQEQVEKAILVGAAHRGWTANKVRNGLIQATLNIRSHQVEVEIPYNADSYSILYKHSENLRYDSKKGTIHPRYNTWINNLNSSINERLY
ncbi:MAG: hypothetical protein IJB96_00515 [Lachnospira sp.]|nr:hypothetical protein [Lachnospira sp.]